MNDWIVQIENEKTREKAQEEACKIKTFEDEVRILHNYHPFGYLNTSPIKYLDEYLKIIRLVTNPSTWFRGESRIHDSFVPKLYRNIDDDKIDIQLNYEKLYFKEFRRRAQHLAKEIKQEDFWSWYFLIQHYGGPTRLLDWTNDAAVALFMALDTSRDKKENPVIYLLSPGTLLDYAFTDIGAEKPPVGRNLYPGEKHTDNWIANIIHDNVDIPDSPISLLPIYSDSRIIAQSSCFTLFGKRRNGFIKDGKEIVCPCCDRRIMNKIIIDGNYKDSLRNELIKIGATSERIYPGLEGVCKQLTEELFKKR